MKTTGVECFPYLEASHLLPMWLKVQCLANMEKRPPHTMEEVFERVLRYVTDQVSSDQVETFMVGICERPDLRWEDPEIGGYKPAQHFDEMYLLFASMTSKKKNHKWSHASTGLVETRLIDSFEGNGKMLNKPGTGGDKPSEGSPHFLYLVLQFTVM